MYKFFIIILLVSISLHSQPATKIHLLTYEGTINPVTSDIIRDAIQQTYREGGEC